MSLLCENGSKTLHRFLDTPLYEGRVASAIFHDSARVPVAMQKSSFYMNAQLSDEELDDGKEKDTDGLRLVIVLLCLLFSPHCMQRE